MTKPQLIAELKAKGIKGYSKLNKAELIFLLKEGTKSVEPVVPAKRIIKPFSSSKLTKFIAAGPYGFNEGDYTRATAPQGIIRTIPFRPQYSDAMSSILNRASTQTRGRQRRYSGSIWVGSEESRLKERESRRLKRLDSGYRMTDSNTGEETIIYDDDGPTKEKYIELLADYGVVGVEKFNKSKLGDFFSDVLRIEQDIGMGAFRNANIGFKNGKIFKKMK